ncbi:type II secretion system F family protein [Ferviditalea candida]|uniref:Type II secretion system protein GspF domain-containing protein n=1 Tax=Ferviditalea candida TaxID=3108399 RepID=A0ABU5ZI22_9BACL|nr:hypothetical protein [Paenibacillaceae bacterium T2]
MIAVAKAALLLLLLILFYLFIRLMLLSLISRQSIRGRLSYQRNRKYLQRLAAGFPLLRRIHGHVKILNVSVGKSGGTQAFFVWTAMLSLSGIILGTLFFDGFRGVVSVALMLGGLPYLFLRIRLFNLQMQTRLELLPALEVFYHSYVLSENKNIRSVLKDSLKGNRLRYPMKPIMEQLYRNLMIGKEYEDGLHIFEVALGSLWGGYFSGILRVGLEEGVDVSENLRELIEDMRRAQRTDQIDRNRLLEIRMANFTPIVFLSVFMLINFKLNFQQAYHYYVVDATGREMLLDAFVLIFVSFLVGIYLSVRRI